MGIEAKKLVKHISEEMVIYPYRDISDDDWPTYLDSDGKWVSYDAGWKEVGFNVPYPTVKRLREISDISQGLEFSKKSLQITSGDPEKLAKYFINNLIKGIVGVTDGGKAVSWNQEWKDWLFREFAVSGFLLSNFRSTYEMAGGKIDRRDREDEESFLSTSVATSSIYSEGTESPSKGKKESSQTSTSPDE